MSMFRDAWRAMLLKNLYCRRCKAMNGPGGAKPIDVDTTGSRAKCTSCSAEGPIETFQPPVSKENGHA